MRPRGGLGAGGVGGAREKGERVRNRTSAARARATKAAASVAPPGQAAPSRAVSAPTSASRDCTSAEEAARLRWRDACAESSDSSCADTTSKSEWSAGTKWDSSKSNSLLLCIRVLPALFDAEIRGVGIFIVVTAFCRLRA